MPQLRQHSWNWLLDHSSFGAVDSLRNSGFNSCAVVPYFYDSMVTVDQPDYMNEVKSGDVEAGAIPRENVIRIGVNGNVKYYRKLHVKQSYRKEGKLIVHNRGSNVRIMPYSVENAELMGLKEAIAI